MGPLFARLSDHQAHTYQLVLSASRIPHITFRQNSSWAIEVPHRYRQAAITAVSLYLAENPESSVTESPTESAPANRPAGIYSAVYVMVMLGIIHWAVQAGHERQVFINAYGADSTAILDGEAYRCVTAMLFHSDWSHLFSNLLGLALFGTAVAATCGWGVGWLLILVSGGLGNLFNAIWYGNGHLSIGASTAVFAAVGLCAVSTFGLQIRRRGRSWRAWIPLGGGLALLAFLGAAPQSDVMSHFFGFGAGLILGGLYTWRFMRPLAWPVQSAALLLAVAMVAASWMTGMAGN